VGERRSTNHDHISPARNVVVASEQKGASPSTGSLPCDAVQWSVPPFWSARVAAGRLPARTRGSAALHACSQSIHEIHDVLKHSPPRRHVHCSRPERDIAATWATACTSKWTSSTTTPRKP